MGERYKLGNVIRLSTTVRDAAGALVDPADLTATLKTPAGATVAVHDYNPGPIVRESLGVFHDDVLTGAGGTITATGTYFYEWASTGTTGLASGWLDVVAATPDLVTLADARAALGKSRSVDDTELQLFVDAVNRWLDEELGPIVPRQVTELVNASGGQFELTGPVISVLSATRSGVSVSVSGWTVGRGWIVSGASGVPLYGTYAVTYLAGYSPIPADLVIAARELVQHWWATQRAASPPLAAGGFDESGAIDPRLGFAVPNRVEEKLAHYRPVGIA